MEFNDPPSILGGITHPQVIQTQGAGEAMAGGLSAVLAAILQKQQLDQEHQVQSANMAQKQAQTEHELQLAKLTGAQTDEATQRAKALSKAADDLQQKQMYEKVANSFVGAHPEFAKDAPGFWNAAHQAMEAGALPRDILPQLGTAYSTIGTTTEQVGKALKAQAEGNVAQQTQGSDIAAANLKPADITAGIGQKRAETGAAQALAATRQQDVRDAKQKASDTEMQRYLLANDNDPMTAYAKYIQDKGLTGKKIAGPEVAMQFQALAKSPVIGLKPADIRAATTRFDADTKDLKLRGSSMGAALTSLHSALTNPSAYGSAISKFVQAVDQDKNLRYQLLQYYEKNINPDIKDTFGKTIAKYGRGGLPLNVAQGMFSHLMDMRQQYKSQYDARQQFFANKYPEAADKFQPSDVYFGKDEDYTLSAPGAAPSDSITNQLMKKYGLTPR